MNSLCLLQIKVAILNETIHQSNEGVTKITLTTSSDGASTKSRHDFNVSKSRKYFHFLHTAERALLKYCPCNMQQFQGQIKI
jgi:hypothetical protein